MAADLTSLERAYFVRKLGGTQLPTEPLNNIKREYMVSVVGATPRNMPFHQLEKQWLLAVIGGAARDWNSIEELWRQAVLSISQVPVKNLEANKIKFYVNAP